VRILFDPMPVARLGIDLQTENVIIGNDFSCVAFMIEEYLAHGMTKLVIPKSRPETSLVPDMPRSVQNRVEICDDAESIASAGRILFHARLQVGATYDDESGRVRFQRETPREIQDNLISAHNIVRRLAFAFRYQTGLEMIAKAARANLTDLRVSLTHTGERSILAELEGVLSQYNPLSFEGVRLDRLDAATTLNALDQILSDPSYTGYSTAISHLGPAEHRRRAFSDIRRYGRLMLESRLASLGWSTLSAVVSAFTGSKLPSLQDLKKDLPPNPMPLMLDLQNARQRAIDSWKVNPPEVPVTCGRSKSTPARDIAWLAPCPSISASKTGAALNSLGTVRELQKALETFEIRNAQIR
jgi:hypothetical protein